MIVQIDFGCLAETPNLTKTTGLNEIRPSPVESPKIVLATFHDKSISTITTPKRLALILSRQSPRSPNSQIKMGFVEKIAKPASGADLEIKIRL